MKAILALEDGTVFEGESVGVTGEAVGKVVFTTVMSGFLESLTDPRYRGMLLTFTDPLVDNYGVNTEDKESDHVQCRGVIMKDPSQTPSNFRSETDIQSFLKKNKVVGICGIDTRMLTRKIRDDGAMMGIITTAENFDFSKCAAKFAKGVVNRPACDVSIKKTKEYKVKNEQSSVALIDLGVTASFVQGLLADDKRVVRFPMTATIQEIKAAKPDRIIISDGPGNPNEYPELLKLMQDIAETKLPVLAIGLGHQLMATSFGMKAIAMPFGHHGNHPVKDLDRDTVFATAPNQNYTLDPNSIKKSVCKVSHVNMHDNTIEGVSYLKYPIIGLQFYPDVVKGAHNASYLMTAFDLMK